MISKSANQGYRAYKKKGGTLPFTLFLDQEKERLHSVDGSDPSMLLINQSLNDTVQSSVKKITESQGLQTTETGKTVFGIKKNIVIGGGLILAAVVILLTIKHKK